MTLVNSSYYIKTWKLIMVLSIKKKYNIKHTYNNKFDIEQRTIKYVYIIWLKEFYYKYGCKNSIGKLYK